MNLPVPVAVGLWVVLGIVLILAVVIGFSRRRQEGGDTVPALYDVPTAAALGSAVAGPFNATYVSTTQHGDWLRRIGVFGLGNRADATIATYAAGLLIARTGEQDVFIPADKLTARTAASGIAGKYAPHEGIDVVTWQASGTALLVDTGLRVADKHVRADLRAALDSLLASGDQAGRAPSENSSNNHAPSATENPQLNPTQPTSKEPS